MILVKFNPAYEKQEADDIEEFVNELPWRVPKDSRVYTHVEPNYRYLFSVLGMGGASPPPVEVLVALAGVSGAVITATVTGLYQALSKYLERDTNREVTIEVDGKKITLRGHSLKDSKQLLKELYPKVFETPISEIPPSLFEEYYGDDKGVWIKSDVPEDLDLNNIDVNDYYDLSDHGE